MLGHDHALSGALAFAAVAPLLPVKLAERWVISPLLLIGLAYFVWHDAGGPALTTASPGWP